MGGRSITLESSIGINGLAVSLQTLIDDGAIAFLVINSRVVYDIAHYLSLPIRKLPHSFKVKGFDAVVRTVVTEYLSAHFMVEQRKFYNTPFVIADIGSHDLIIGKLFLEKFKILVDPANHRLIWPDDRPPSLSVIRQRLMYPDQIRRRAINQKFQEDVNRRDAALAGLNTTFASISRAAQPPQPRQPGILNISMKQIKAAPKIPPPKPIKEQTHPSVTSHGSTYHWDQVSCYRKMHQELLGIPPRQPQSRLPRPTGMSTPDRVKSLNAPSIALISGQAMVCNIKRAGNTIFVASMSEIDAAIRDKYEATLAQEDPDTEQLIRERLPRQYWDYADAFSKRESNELPPYREGVDHKIELTQPLPTHWSPLYKLSRDELVALKQWITDNMDKGFIDHSQAPFASPILFAKKSGGGLRLCVDYRKLNLITKKDSYPIPLISELLARVSRAKIFTKLDIRQAFNRIRMDPAAEDMTTFRCPLGTYKSKVLPFGLTNGPATFQRWINKILYDYLDDFCAAYLDDIMIFSADPLEHEVHVKKVLDRLREHGLQADIKKSEFHVTRTKFLGFIVTTEGIEVDPEKTEALRTWRYPSTVTEVRGFLGFTGFYRQFVRDYQAIAKPLNNLTKEGVPFRFDDDCKRAFDEIKRILLSPVVLKHFVYGYPTMVETDSSDGTLGGILSQQHPDGRWYPVAFFSRTMLPAECNYEIHDKELLAIVRVFEAWRAELISTRDIQVFSDHRALEYFMTTKSLTSRQVRWAEILAEYDFRIMYRSGKQNLKADVLSRRLQDKEAQSKLIRDNRLRTLLPTGRLDPAIVTDLCLLDLEIELAPVQLAEPLPLLERLFQENCASHQELRDELPTGYHLDQNVLYKDGRLALVKDSELTTLLIQEAHSQISSAHPSAHKTYLLLKSRYYWPGMESDIERYVENCVECRKTKTSKVKQPGLLRPLPVPDRPWEHLTTDLMDAPPTKQGYDCVWVIIDRFGKESISVPCRRTIDAIGIAKLFVEHVWRRGHTPVSIVSDRGPQFISSFWKEVCRILGIKVVLSTAFHKETDGQTEIMNQHLTQRLRPYVNFYQDNWDELLPIMDRAQVTLPHSSLGDLSPYEVYTGFEPRTSFDWKSPAATTPSEKVNHAQAKLFAKRLEDVHHLAKNNLLHTQKVKANSVNRHRQPVSWTIGDEVYLSTRNLRTGRPMKKLEHKWEGPFKVVAQKGYSYELALPKSWDIHPVFAPELLRKNPQNPLPGQNTDSNSADYYDEVVEDKEYEVEQIIASRLRRRKLQYQAKWTGYTADQEWYDADNFEHAPFKLRDFHEANPAAPGPPATLKRWIEVAERELEKAHRDKS